MAVSQSRTAESSFKNQMVITKVADQGMCRIEKFHFINFYHSAHAAVGYNRKNNT